MRIAILVGVMLAAGQARGLDLDPWDPVDVALEAGFAAAVLVDVRQTRWAMRNGYSEVNPLLGSEHPSDLRLGLAAGASILAHAAVSALMPRDARKWFQTISLGFEGAVVGTSFSMGIRLEL